MPAIFGRTHFSGDKIANQIGEVRQKFTKKHENDILDAIYEDKIVVATGNRLAFQENFGGFFQKNDDLLLWLDGEAIDFPKNSFAPALLTAFEKNQLSTFLSEIDGYFSAVLYDKKQQKIQLISDRHGMKPLFFTQKNGDFAWSSMANIFPELLKFSPKIDLRAVHCLMDLGYLVGDLTMLEGVFLLDAATILTFDLTQKTLKKARYWSWQKFEKKDISFKKAVETAGFLFQNAVKKRISPEFENGITLSGGLDSRAILAASSQILPLPTFTFGTRNCLEMDIAREAARRANCPNLSFEISPENWMNGRKSGVLKTDGMYSWLHQHFDPFLPEIVENMNMNLSGFAGDMIFGGSLLSPFEGQKPLEKAFQYFGKRLEWLEPNRDFYHPELSDSLFMDTRVRRFTRSGSTIFEAFCGQRKPFLDNDLMAFLYSLPTDFRQKNRLYSEVLLQFFPTFYEGLVWHKTRTSIDQKTTTKLVKLLKIRQLQHRLGSRMGATIEYDKLMRTQPARDFLVKTLDPKIAIYPQILDENFLKKYVEPHFTGRDFSEKIGRAMTLEIWLSFLFDVDKFCNF